MRTILHIIFTTSSLLIICFKSFRIVGQFFTLILMIEGIPGVIFLTMVFNETPHELWKSECPLL